MRFAFLICAISLAGCTIHTYEPAPAPQAATTVVVPSTPGSVGTVVTTHPGTAVPTSTTYRPHAIKKDHPHGGDQVRVPRKSARRCPHGRERTMVRRRGAW